jgi:cellulose synthase/poly-beta-1,6-N-acetylglucosamine synthase-like glycosyltransferase
LISPENWPSVTIQIPVYTESFKHVIRNTLILSLKAAKGKANIIVYDDGLMHFAEDDLEEFEKMCRNKYKSGESLSNSQEEVLDRLDFYRNNRIAFIARSKYGRAGLFKKASNLNNGMELAIKIEDDIRSSGTTYELAMKKVLASYRQSRPIFAEGNVLLGDFLVLLDKDSGLHEDIIGFTLPEFLESPNLGFTQHRTVPSNPDEKYFANLIAKFTHNLYYLAIGISARNGDLPPLVGHNAFFRKQALMDVRKTNNGMFWSVKVSEDFDLMMRMHAQGYY